MKSDRVLLKPNAMAEPLINQWYAWPYLISPATAASNRLIEECRRRGVASERLFCRKEIFL